MDQTDTSSEPILSDRIRVNGTVTTAQLTAAGVLRWFDGGRRRSLDIEKNVIGFAAEGSRIRIRAIVENSSGIKCGASKGSLTRKSFVLEPLTGGSLRPWSQKFQEYIDSFGKIWVIAYFMFVMVVNVLHLRPKKLLIFVNPYGGRKSASKIFVDDVKPLLDDANVEYTVQETKYQLHAKEVAQTLDLSKFDGIICVSGDGILVEVINGLLERDDWKTAIRTPLGVVPAGTSNGMVKSLLDSVGDPCTAAHAVLAIVRGHKRSLDVATILQDETKYFSVLMFAWGLVADIDIESEKYRWMGSARIDFYAIQRILRLRKYNGCISFVPAPGFEDFGEPSSSKLDSCSLSDEKPVKIQQHGYQGPVVDLESQTWRKIDGPFVSIWLHNVPWGGEDTMAAPDAKVAFFYFYLLRGQGEVKGHIRFETGGGGKSPFGAVVPLIEGRGGLVQFSDGYLDLILIKDCPKLSLLALMSELSSGGHVKSPHVLYLKAKAFIVEPGPRTEDPTKEGIIDADGEVLARGKGTYKCNQPSKMAYGKLQIIVDQGLATLFSPI
ncbi:hypothetical protein RJ640_017649 [Escallonia rubra]|uniref:sphingosine kinase n=1 Tax=Escallonia rubra TaxID=112253 RepID=A0AA88RN46_9ASTE|nr:hypothetical protein RJ640_017649 [Escallonia rubra]